MKIEWNTWWRRWWRWHEGECKKRRSVAHTICFTVDFISIVYVVRTEHTRTHYTSNALRKYDFNGILLESLFSRFSLFATSSAPVFIFSLGFLVYVVSCGNVHCAQQTYYYDYYGEWQKEEEWNASRMRACNKSILRLQLFVACMYSARAPAHILYYKVENKVAFCTCVVRGWNCGFWNKVGMRGGGHCASPNERHTHTPTFMAASKT